MAIIDKPSDFFNPKIYTGNQSSTHAVTGVGFQPDLSWFKIRNGTGSHYLFDVIRGVTKSISSDSGGAESTQDYLSSFDTDGFTLGSASNNVNGAYNYVSWNWKAGGSASSNSNGSITSSVSANTTAGFSIVKWTGNGSTATIGHGLGVAPSAIIVKNYSASMNWISYWKTLGANKYLEFNLANAAGTGTTEWNNTSPTSSVFSVGNTGSGNQNNGSLVAYCFAEKQGYSKFGSYLGFNSGEYGPFIYTGFKPAFVLIKDSSAANAWTIRDDKRNTFNPATNFLMPNETDAEVTAGEAVDILSNGFKIKANGGKVQDSGNTYIYMAFAENPFVASNFNAATAR